MFIEIKAQADIKPFIESILEICAKGLKYKIKIKKRNKFKMPTYTVEIKEEVPQEKLIYLLLYNYHLTLEVIIIGKRGGRTLYPLNKRI